MRARSAKRPRRGLCTRRGRSLRMGFGAPTRVRRRELSPNCLGKPTSGTVLDSIAAAAFGDQQGGADCGYERTEARGIERPENDRGSYLSLSWHVGKFAYLTLAVRCVNVWRGQLRAARRLNCCADQEHQDGWHRNSLPKLYSQLGLEAAVSASPLVGRGNIRDRVSRIWRASSNSVV